MPDEVKQGEMPAEPVTPEVKPAVEADEFNKDRAMATIEKLRGFEKQAKAYEKELAVYKQEEQKRKDAELSETEKLQKQLAEAQATLKLHDREALQRQACDEAGIPQSWAKRLTGETIEDLKADADLIAKELPKAGQPKVGTTNPGANATGQGETRQQQLNRIHGQNVDMFDPATAAKHGGGVFINEKSTQ